MDDERPYANLSDVSLIATYESVEGDPDDPESALLLSEIRRRGLPLRGD